MPATDALFCLLRSGNDNQPTPNATASELDCLAGLLPPYLLRDAVARGRDLGVGADRVLVASGAIAEADYLRRFARRSGIAIETFADIAPSDAVLLDDDHMRYAAARGILPMRKNDDLVFVVVLQRLMARELTRLVDRHPDVISRLRIATADDFDTFLLHRASPALAHDSAYGLRDSLPDLSAAPKPRRACKRSRIKRAGASLALAGCLTLPPSFAIGLWTEILALWFVAAIGLRFAAALIVQRAAPASQRLPEAELPVYTVIVALYREARSVAPLLRALAALDYPREKLDIIFATEANDAHTRTAIDRFGLVPNLRVVVATDIAPRTKPKALNCALPFARGNFIAVFDAEDRPDPGQLRAALDTFRHADDDVVCAQASLCIDNAADSLFTRMFAVDYAGQFDAVLPGLAAMRLPLPLGGTSNHFRAAVLRKVGGWDAWNVTEDADLGLRLARFGYRAVTFASTTQEEAPITFAPWLKQRSRWMKGWMQTWSVHMREPRRLWRDAGWGGLVTANLLIGANILGALAYPFLLGGIAVGLASDSRWLADGLLQPVHVAAISIGVFATMAIGMIGLARRGRLRDCWILVLTPIYWGCLSIATWRAFWQLLRDPYRWEKTEHGLARNITKPHSGARSALAERKLKCAIAPRRFPAYSTRPYSGYALAGKAGCEFRNDGTLRVAPNPLYR